MKGADFLMLLFVGILVYAVVSVETYATVSPVKTLGACASSGYCGVITEDGFYHARCYLPVVGAKARCEK